MAAQGKDYNVYMAKMAEQAERYDEMADFMGRIAEENFGKFADESRP